MDILKFKYLIEVYHCRSINKAAQNLFISQSHLSKIIKGMEEKYGLHIFEREGNHLQVTRAGEKFIQDAIYFVSTYEELFEQEREDDLLKIATQKSSYVYQMLAHFLEIHSDCFERMKILEQTQQDILSSLRNGDILAGYLYVPFVTKETFLQQCQHDKLVYQPLMPVYNHLVVHAGHPLAGKKTVSLEDLYHYPLICFDSGGVRKMETIPHYAPFLEVIDVSKVPHIIYVEDTSALHTMIKLTNGYLLGLVGTPMELWQEDNLYGNTLLKLDKEITPSTLELGLVYRQENTQKDADLLERLAESNTAWLRETGYVQKSPL